MLVSADVPFVVNCAFHTTRTKCLQQFFKMQMVDQQLVIGQQFCNPFDTNIQHWMDQASSSLKLCRNQWVTINPTNLYTRCACGKMCWKKMLIIHSALLQYSCIMSLPSRTWALETEGREALIPLDFKTSKCQPSNKTRKVAHNETHTFGLGPSTAEADTVSQAHIVPTCCQAFHHLIYHQQRQEKQFAC